MANVYKARVLPEDITFPCREDEPILAAARRAGWWLPFECGWGTCGTCKVILAEGEVELLFPEAPSLTPRDARRNRILTCQSVPKSDLVIKVLQIDAQPPEDLPVEDYTGQLLTREELGPNIYRIRFDVGRVARFRPGQYAILQLGPRLRRCYSMSNLPGSRLVEFIFKRYPGHPGSERLAALEIGAQIPMEFPFGRAYLHPSERDMVFVAGGTGIAPIFSMLQQVLQEPALQPKLRWLFYGANTLAELVLHREIEQMMGTLPDALFVPVLLKERVEELKHEKGFIHEIMGRYITSFASYDYYMAGPPAMVQAMLKYFEEQGVPPTQIYYDSFG